MWNKTKSLILSRIMTTAATIIVLLMTFFVPAISEWYNDISEAKGFFESINITIPMCIILYICESLALMAFHSLHTLLKNISNDKVFVKDNSDCLRKISWECMLAGAAFLILGIWRFVFIFPAFMAVMFGLIMRVLKNVFEKAVEIKTENDFTI
ncbi:MAG: DUF2975 domain-containing protein [Ruminococcus sp.]|jgi:hypothetical protein|nr:DUF2975 domain-containing protein [Ruminococcus sp.]